MNRVSSAARISLALLYGEKLTANVIMSHFAGTQGDMFHTPPHLADSALNVADRIIAKCEKHDINVVSILDEAYPSFLKSIPAPPPILFLRGNPDVLKELPGVAVVGSRDSTANGLEIARRLAGYLSRKGWVIISGLAMGIDAAAHEGCLDARGLTIAVLAHGLTRAYPAKNEALAKRILNSGGLWISEHAPDIAPLKHHFVERNRIQAGLGAGSIIVEGAIQSGSMTQAQYCLGQKRRLFAVVPSVPSNPLGLHSDGPQFLVDSQGAYPIRSMADYEAVEKILDESREHLLSM